MDSGTGEVPFPIDDTIAGQKNVTAIPVNRLAAPSDKPAASATVEATLAAVCPGSESIGQMDWPMAIALAGSVETRPVFVSAATNASPVGSACTGAASTTFAVIRPADTASMRTALECLRCIGAS